LTQIRQSPPNPSDLFPVRLARKNHPAYNYNLRRQPHGS
jgi:hypothetical protein